MYGPGCSGQSAGQGCRAFAYQLRPALLLVNILEEALVQVASLMFARKNEDESLVAEHFKGSVAKCRAAHSLRVEVVRLFNDQSSGSNRSQRGPSAHEEQMSNAFEHLRQVLYMCFPAGQVISNCRASSLKFLPGTPQITLAHDIAKPLQSHQSRYVGLARN